MFIAHELKQKNLAEYLLYMWQVEDLIRAFQFDINKIDEQFITPMQLPDEQHHQERTWYSDLINMMKAEQVTEKGHVQIIKNILLDLQETHIALLSSPDGATYRAKLMQLTPSLMLLKGKSDDPTMSDLEMCFVFLYCIMKLRRERKEISDDTAAIANQVGQLLATLAKAYNG